MASSTAQRKRLLEDQMTSAGFTFKAAKRELIAGLDQAKNDRMSDNAAIRSQADLQYNTLLTQLHSRNRAFDELMLDFKSQIYDLEAHDLHQASHKSTIASACPANGSPSRGPGLQSATTTSPSTKKGINRVQKTKKNLPDNRLRPPLVHPKSRAASLQTAKSIEQIEKSLIMGQFEGFSYIRSVPILVREHAQTGQRRDRWVQMHCAACGSTVKLNNEFFRGVIGLLNHINGSSCRGACDALGLEPWDYMILHCMQEVSEEYVVMVTSGRIDIPKIYTPASKSDEPKETKEQAAERIRISRLQSNNSFYNKPPPRKHVPIIIDLDSDAEDQKGHANCSVDQHDAHKPHDIHQSPLITGDLRPQVCESIKRSATEPLPEATKSNEDASQLH